MKDMLEGTFQSCENMLLVYFSHYPSEVALYFTDMLDKGRLFGPVEVYPISKKLPTGT
jgi:hypothetical protein